MSELRQAQSERFLSLDKTSGGILLVGLLLAAVPWLGLPSFYESFLYLLCHWMILALSWNILSGYSGYFSFGHGAFFGVGMYTTAVLSGKLEWSFLATLPIAALLAALLGVALGLVVFRVKGVRGELFALLTLAITFVVGTIILNTPIDGGPGIALSGVAIPKIAPTASASIYLLALGVAVLTIFLSYRIQHSKLGLGLFAIHDDEDVAEVMGVPTLRYKLAAFGLSCALAGLAGGIHALFVNYVTVGETFTITVPLTVVLMSVLGGTRHWAGPAVGAIAITCLLYFLTAGSSPILGKAMVGMILVVVILFMPEGILGFWLKRNAQAFKPMPVRPQPVEGQASKGLRQAQPERMAQPEPVASGKPLLQVQNLSKAFKGVQALDGVTLDVREGEILGLLGPNGSGKSTFINVVSGHYPKSGGQIMFVDRDISHLAPHNVAQSGIARTYQIPRPFAHLTALQNVSLVAMFGAGQNQRLATEQAWQWLEFTGLTHKAHLLPDALNLHERKFLELARALAAKPRLVLLDEVLSGLTPSEINEAIELIRRIRAQGSTIVFVEHVMHAVMALADRVAVLNHGKLIALGLPNDVMTNPEVVSAYLGTAHA